MVWKINKKHYTSIEIYQVFKNISPKNEKFVEYLKCFVQWYVLHDKHVLYLIGTGKHSASLNKSCINILQILKYTKFSKYYPQKWKACRIFKILCTM